MADKQQPAPQKKRRIRPAVQSVREQAQSASRKSQQTAKVKNGALRRFFRTIAKPLRRILRPLAWLGRHLVPRYLTRSFAELKLVTWPSRRETRRLTGAVIIFAIIFGALISGVDYGLDKAFKAVFLK